jgi:hypothetical protein
MVTANTRYKRKPFVKESRALEHNLVAFDRVDGDIDRFGSHRQTV